MDRIASQIAAEALNSPVALTSAEAGEAFRRFAERARTDFSRFTECRSAKGVAPHRLVA